MVTLKTNTFFQIIKNNDNNHRSHDDNWNEILAL